MGDIVSIIGTLGGVVIGLLGGEGVRYLREKRQKEHRTKVIAEDMKNLQRQLPVVRSLIRDIEDKTKNGLTAKFQYDVICKLSFQKIFPLVYEYYSHEERQCLSVLISGLERIGTEMDAFPINVDSTLEPDTPYGKKLEARLTMLEWLSDLCLRLISTTDAYLEGDIEKCMKMIGPKT